MTQLTVVSTSAQGTILEALRGLLQNAIRAGATNIRVDLHPHRTVVGHNGTAPGSLEELFQVTGEPRDRWSAERDLQALLNPSWCTQIRVSTLSASAFVDLRTAESLWVPETGSPALEGTWWEIHGENQAITAHWLGQCVGFTDVDLQVGEVLQPAPTRGDLVLSSELLDLHLYDPSSVGPGDDRSLKLGWCLIHMGSEGFVPHTGLFEQACEVLTEQGRPDLAGLLLRMHVVLTQKGARELVSPSSVPMPGSLNERALLQELKKLMSEFPVKMATLVEPVVLHVTEGMEQTELMACCEQANVPFDWVQVELLRAGWRSCPALVLERESKLPQPFETWHRHHHICEDIQSVLCNNLLCLFGDERLPAALALSEDQITLRPHDLPIHLSAQGIRITEADRVRGWMKDPHKRLTLLTLVQGLVVCEEDDTFFTEPKDLSKAELLLNLTLMSSA